MRAATANQRTEPLEIAARPDPSPAAGEVVLSVEACGICGSDLHLHSNMDLPGVVLGHEFCGEVVGRAADVDRVQVGDRVVGLSLATCGVCDACRSGRVRKCERASMVGIERPGAYAELVALPAHDVLRLPAGFPVGVGALVEPLAVARHALERGGEAEGEHALVLGAGPVGLAVALWLRHEGAAAVAVTDPAPHRRERASRLGADLVLDPEAGEVGAQFAASVGTAPTVVYECVGLPGLIESAALACGIDGRVVVVGVCFGADTIVPLTAMSKELDVRYTFYYRRQDFEATIGALDAGSLPGEQLITGEVTLDELPGRFAALEAGRADDVKVLLRP